MESTKRVSDSARWMQASSSAKKRRGIQNVPFEFDRFVDFADLYAQFEQAPLPKHDNLAFKTLFIDRATRIGSNPVPLVDAIWTNAREGPAAFAVSSAEAFERVCLFIDAAASHFELDEHARRELVAKARRELQPPLSLGSFNAANAVAIVSMDAVRDMRSEAWSPNFGAMRKRLDSLMGGCCNAASLTEETRRVVLGMYGTAHVAKQESKTMSLDPTSRADMDTAIVFILRFFAEENSTTTPDLMQRTAAVAVDACQAIGYKCDELNAVFAKFLQSFGTLAQLSQNPLSPQ